MSHLLVRFSVHHILMRTCCIVPKQLSGKLGGLLQAVFVVHMQGSATVSLWGPKHGHQSVLC